MLVVLPSSLSLSAEYGHINLNSVRIRYMPVCFMANLLYVKYLSDHWSGTKYKVVCKRFVYHVLYVILIVCFVAFVVSVLFGFVFPALGMAA